MDRYVVVAACTNISLKAIEEMRFTRCSHIPPSPSPSSPQGAMSMHRFTDTKSEEHSEADTLV